MSLTVDKKSDWAILKMGEIQPSSVCVCTQIQIFETRFETKMNEFTILYKSNLIMNLSS